MKLDFLPATLLGGESLGAFTRGIGAESGEANFGDFLAEIIAQTANAIVLLAKKDAIQKDC